MKKFFTLFLSILAVNIAWAEDETFYDEASGLYFTIEGENAEITYSDNEDDSSYPDLSGELTIPETVYNENIGYTVTSIGSKAFYKCEITSVDIPETVTNIGNYAFAYTLLKSIYIPKSVETIATYAFAYCNYAEKIIFDPDTQVQITGDYCFQEAGTKAESPLSIEFSKGMGSLYKGMFFRAMIGSMKFDNTIAGTYIGEYAFQEISDGERGIVKTVELPEGITEIVHRAFWGDYTIETLVLPSTLTEIGKEGLSLTSDGYSVISKFYCKATTPPTVDTTEDTNGGIYFGTANPTLYVPSSSVEAYKTAWSDYFENIESYDFPDFKIDDIYYKIIDESNTVEVVAGPVEYEGEIVIPNEVEYENTTYTVTEIGKEAFYKCTLTKVTIPASMTTIGIGAFNRCYDLTTVIFEEGSQLKEIGDYAFQMCPTTSMVLPESCTTIGYGAFYQNKFVEFEFPDGIEEINFGMFAGCEYLETVTIPQSVTAIDDWVFVNCSSLKTINCNSTTVPILGKDVFVTGEYDYTLSGDQLDNVTGNLTGITMYVADGMKRLYEADETWTSEFTNNENTIAGDPIEIDDIYYYYLSDTELEVTANDEKYSGVVTIPVEVNDLAVTTIGEGAFTDCEGLKSLVIESETPLTVNDGAFDEKPEIAYTIWVPKNTKSTYIDAGWGAYVVDEDENIQEIPDYYIDGIYYNIVEVEIEEYGLKASTISLEVTNGPEAYEGDITIPESRTISLGNEVTVTYDVTSISSTAFKDCADLTSITIESSTPLENADALNQVPEACVIVVPNTETKSVYESILTNVNIYTEEEYKNLLNGIKIKTIEREEIERYNLLGQKIANPQNGINIIKYSDGTVEKVLVK